MYNSFIKPLAVDVKNFLLDTLFPITCTNCGKEENFLCADCQSKLQKLDFQQCIMCHKPSPLGLTHSGCKTAFGPDGLISFYDYHDKKISESIINGKYYFIDGIYKLFGQLVANEIKQREYKNIFGIEDVAARLGVPSDVVRPIYRAEADKPVSTRQDHLSSRGGSARYSLVPIPLYKSRERWRGFNQAEVLCQKLSEELGLPIANILMRTKNTKTQKDLKRDDRIHNVDGVFRLSPLFSKDPSRLEKRFDRAEAEGVRGSSFILVDDVITTGSTLLEAAKVLKRNGAGQVWCLTVARD